MTTVPADVVIVGASVAGVSTADALRASGYQGRIRLVDAEGVEPYDKPQLSKQALGVAWDPQQASLRGPGHFASHDIDLVLGNAVIGFDAERRVLRLANGESLGADAIVLAPGARPRRLPDEHMLPGVHTLRTLSDARAIREGFTSRPRVVVLGGGFIGLEVASAARSRGLDVTVVEMTAQPLGVALGARAALAMTTMHRDAGVRFETGVGVEAALGGKRVERVLLRDGRLLDADLVVVGFGVVPATDWLKSSGVRLANGIVCDEFGRTNVTGVYAAGDAAAWGHPADGTPTRIEHWTTAQQHGHALGYTITHPDSPRRPPTVPYFWSDQLGVRLQSLGRVRDADEVTLQHGSWTTRDFVALYRKGDRLVGAVGVNAARRLMPYRALIERAESWDAALDAFPSSAVQTA
jgi:NADPH-dependent 2,4-dienoyl-CoA reductase/sulfur reductase-like enzyme